MAKLIGTDPNQVPTNADLGTMAYQNAERPVLGQTLVKSGGTSLIVERTGDAPNLQLKGNGQNLGHIYAFQNGSGGDIAFYPTNSSGSITQRMKIHSDGYVTMPYQPAFLAVATTSQTNIPTYTLTNVVFGTEVFDQGGDFSSNTFTAPVTGRYQLSFNIRMNDVDHEAVFLDVRLKTSNRDYQFVFANDDDLESDASFVMAQLNTLADMDAGDTAYVNIYQEGGTAQMDLDIQGSCCFSGYLVA